MHRFLLVLVGALAFGACQSAADTSTDAADGTEETAAEAPETDAAYEAAADSSLAAVEGDLDASRIVVLGGPITETVYALGLGDNVVASDQSSLFPAGVMQKPRLNYFRQTSAEGVLAQEPTVVLASDGTGPPDVLDQIRATGVTVVTVPSPETVAGAYGRVQMLGRALGREAQADSLVSTMQDQLAEASALQPDTPPRALFVYARGAGLVQVLGTETTASLVLQLAGAENAAGIPENAPLTAEAVVAAAPDVVVIPSRGLDSIGGPDGLFAQPGLAQTPAGENRRVVAVDDALLLGLGPRLGEAIQELARGLSAPAAEAVPTETASL